MKQVRRQAFGRNMWYARNWFIYLIHTFTITEYHIDIVARITPNCQVLIDWRVSDLQTDSLE